MKEEILDLTKGLDKNERFEAFKFAGGEVHFKFIDNDYKAQVYKAESIKILTRIHNSDELMLLIMVVDMLRKDNYKNPISVVLPYFPYAQADRDFNIGETFSLKTLSKLLRVIDVDHWTVFDAHSDSTQMSLNSIEVISPYEAISEILRDGLDSSNLAIMSPDNGAYKRVKKIIEKINWKGDFFTANKDRNISSGNIDDISFNIEDFEGRDLLVIDDICIGGRTFIELAKKLKEKNVGKLYLYVSHGLFTHGTDPVLEYYDKIFTTNSRKESVLLESQQVRVMDVFKYIK